MAIFHVKMQRSGQIIFSTSDAIERRIMCSSASLAHSASSAHALRCGNLLDALSVLERT
jgi:hypothetical protein